MSIGVFLRPHGRIVSFLGSGYECHTRLIVQFRCPELAVIMLSWQLQRDSIWLCPLNIGY